MEKLIPGIVLFILITSCDPKVTASTGSDKVVNELVYDSTLATELGADQYGMRRYVMAFLKEGPNRDQDSTTAAEIQRAHLDNIVEMADAAKLVLAGPYMDNFEIKGIYIFAVETVEEAEELTKTDPAITSGRLVMELHPWYGSAAMMKINELHKQISKEDI